MVIRTKANGKIINSMGEEFKSCMMDASTKETGLKAACTEEDFIRGRMEKNTKENMS